MLTSKENAKDLSELRDRIETGEVTPAIDRTYPLSEAADAIQYLHDGQARGKVVITVDRP
jgi:NADPH:quinone reductase-like Zn-dependent oxidoreductase